MSGTKAGAAKARQSLIKKYGSVEKYELHMKSIAIIGGSQSTPTGGFAHPDANPQEAGRKGGTTPRRKKNA